MTVIMYFFNEMFVISLSVSLLMRRGRGNPAFIWVFLSYNKGWSSSGGLNQYMAHMYVRGRLLLLGCCNMLVYLRDGV